MNKQEMYRIQIGRIFRVARDIVPGVVLEGKDKITLPANWIMRDTGGAVPYRTAIRERVNGQDVIKLIPHRPARRKKIPPFVSKPDRQMYLICLGGDDAPEG